MSKHLGKVLLLYVFRKSGGVVNNVKISSNKYLYKIPWFNINPRCSGEGYYWLMEETPKKRIKWTTESDLENISSEVYLIAYPLLEAHLCVSKILDAHNLVIA